MVKITLDRAQSGGDVITIMDDERKILYHNYIHLLPEKDGIIIYDTSNFKTELE